MLEIVSSTTAAAGHVPDTSGVATPLLALAGPLKGSHALVLGVENGDVLYSLLRSECGSAASLRGMTVIGAREIDIVFAPAIRDMSAAAELPHLARRVLRPAGRLVAHVAGPRTGEIGKTLLAGLQREGFATRQTMSWDAGFIVRTDLPARLHARQRVAA